MGIRSGHRPIANFGALADKLKEKLEKILPVVTTIGIAFAMWKIGKPIFHGLELILGVKGLKGVLEKLGLSGGAVAGVAAAVLICVARFTELYTKSENSDRAQNDLGRFFKRCENSTKLD